MNVVVWIVTVLLAAVFLAAGVMKLTRAQSELVRAGQGWAGDLPAGLVKGIGVAEVLGAIGLIVPGVFGVATWLVPAAAIGFAIVMVGAVITHGRRHEYPNVIVNLVLLALALFVAIERIGPQSF
ncbi:DoxX family protein [Intrasporangium mesophilum]